MNHHPRQHESCYEDQIKDRFMKDIVGAYSGNMELELRLGKVSSGTKRFVVGTDKAFVEFALALFSGCKEWSLVDDWRETHDFFFGADRHATTRRSIEFDTQNSIVQQSSIRKRKVAEMVLENRLHRFDMKMALAAEDSADDDDAAVLAVPTYVRIKQRKSFYYTSSRFHTPTWRFDITLTWGGRTKNEAEKLQLAAEPTYEFELECLGLANYVLTLQSTNNEGLVLDSFMQKMFDLFFLYGRGVATTATTDTTTKEACYDDFLASLRLL